MNHARLAILAALVVTALAMAQEPCGPQRVISPPDIFTDDFGFNVQTSGDQWMVGTPDARTLCAGSAVSCSSGAVFVYENVEGQLVHAQTIVPADVSVADKFGISMDMDGGRLVVGSLFSRNPGTGFRTGAVFFYEFDGTQWVEVDRVWPPPSVPSEFGKKVALHDDTLIVTTQRGRSAEVYAWEHPGGWRHVQTVTQPDPDGPAIGFGIQWAIRDDWFITGGYLDRRVHPSGGAVFVYRRNADGLLELVQDILADKPVRLGITVDFAGETLVVGAPLASRQEELQGVVRFFEFDGERWVLDGELVQDEPRENRQFGSRVLVEGGRLFVQALGERIPISQGMVYGFEQDGDGAWIQTDRFVPESAFYAGLYGLDLASDGAHLLVGASQDQSASGGVVGAAYYFDLTCGDCPPDLDADGALTIFDFLTFLNLFQDGDALADFDGDGELTIFDFLAFQTAFDAGCE